MCVLTHEMALLLQALGLPTSEALAVGASLAPCSTGVALVVLKRKRCA